MAQETIFQIAKRGGGTEPHLTVYSDGTWIIEGERDAALSKQLDETFVASISIREICLATGAAHGETS